MGKKTWGRGAEEREKQVLARRTAHVLHCAVEFAAKGCCRGLGGPSAPRGKSGERGRGAGVLINLA